MKWIVAKLLFNFHVGNVGLAVDIKVSFYLVFFVDFLWAFYIALTVVYFNSGATIRYYFARGNAL